MNLRVLVKTHGRRAAGAIASLIVFAAVIVVLAHYVVVNTNSENPGQQNVMQDFRDTVYYPTVAFLDGKNPYDPAVSATYPTRQRFPPYSPAILLLYLPFGLLSFGVAQWVFFAMTLTLTLALAYVSLRICGKAANCTETVLLGTLILLSRPAHVNLISGQSSILFVLGVVVAFHYARTKPWYAALGVAIATLKPTYGVPLIVLMMCARHYRAVFAGVGLGSLGAFAATVLLVRRTGAPLAFLQSIHDNTTAFQGTVQHSLSRPWSLSRIDTVAVAKYALGIQVERLGEYLVLMGWLFGVGLLLRQRSRLHGEHRGDSSSSVLVYLTIITCVYHQIYDGLLLVLPLVAIWTARHEPWQSLRSGYRWIFAVVMSVPLLNYLTGSPLKTAVGRELTFTALPVIDGTAILICIALGIWIAGHQPAAPQLPTSAAPCTAGRRLS